METELVETDKYEPLFETRIAKGRLVYRLFSASIFVGIVCVWIYRLIHIPKPGEYGRMGWMGIYGAELWFGIYWVFTQAQRWKLVFRQPFRQTLLKRYGKGLPRVDVFVCTADPATEPPIMVVNTVLFCIGKTREGCQAQLLIKAIVVALSACTCFTFL